MGKIEKPEATTSGFKRRAAADIRKPHTTTPFYYSFRLDARPEAYLVCYYFNLAAVGAGWYFIYAGIALEGRFTVAINVALPANAKTIAKLKDDIVKHPRAKKLTAKPKTAADMA